MTFNFRKARREMVLANTLGGLLLGSGGTQVTFGGHRLIGTLLLLGATFPMTYAIMIFRLLQQEYRKRQPPSPPTSG